MMILSDSQGLCQSDSKPLPTHELQRRNGGNDRERLTAWKDRLLSNHIIMNAEKVKIIKKSFKKWIISTVSMLLMILVLKFTFPIENETDFIKGAAVFVIGDLVSFLWFKIKISITSDED